MTERDLSIEAMRSLIECGKIPRHEIVQGSIVEVIHGDLKAFVGKGVTARVIRANSPPIGKTTPSHTFQLETTHSPHERFNVVIGADDFIFDTHSRPCGFIASIDSLDPRLVGE